MMASTVDMLGRPLRDLRISLTDRCNLRCGYCMPAHIFGPEYSFLPQEHVLSVDEMARLARIFVSLGAAKIRLTGGEPLMRPQVARLVARIKDHSSGPEVALTTNGWFLADQASALKQAGLDRINVSLDALESGVAGKMNGRGWGSERALEGIEAALTAGLPIKVNMVVQRGINENQILPMARFFRDRKVTLRFIEFMDVGNYNEWSRERVVPSAEILEMLSREAELEPVEAGYRGEVAARYRYAGTAVEVGFISSVTAPFCCDCSRARLSADGQLFTCLFATRGVGLKRALRGGASDDELTAIICSAWGGRSDRYSEERAELSETGRNHDKVEMSYIGG